MKQYSFDPAQADAAFAKGAGVGWVSEMVADLIAKARAVDGSGKPTAIMDAFLER